MTTLNNSSGQLMRRWVGLVERGTDMDLPICDSKL
jgi:hypothetical protein